MRRFVADNTVGKLRRWMSLLGYDVQYDRRSARELLADPLVGETGVVVVGRCPSLARDPAVAAQGRFFHVESPDLIEQIRQIVQAFPLEFAQTVFSRCQHCNAPLADAVPLETVADRLPALVKEWCSVFRECPRCRRVYWEGTHTQRVRSVLRDQVGLDV